MAAFFLAMLALSHRFQRLLRKRGVGARAEAALKSAPHRDGLAFSTVVE
jgi:hypothetical protein